MNLPNRPEGCSYARKPAPVIGGQGKGGERIKGGKLRRLMGELLSCHAEG